MNVRAVPVAMVGHASMRSMNIIAFVLQDIITHIARMVSLSIDHSSRQIFMLCHLGLDVILSVSFYMGERIFIVTPMCESHLLENVECRKNDLL